MANREPPDRYQRFAEFADLGTGADEFEGARRFTRPSDRTDEAPVRTAKQAPEPPSPTSTSPARR